ncbi:hypothetical protein LX36DRAFT_715727 [Colletotrichum falcatum]|nr:hypothetical protein LX36DRAFT_715727 [Colletotrichum falcatum]
MGFFGTAWFSTLPVVLRSLPAFNPEENSFGDGNKDVKSLESRQDRALNHVDQTAVKPFNPPFAVAGQKAPGIHAAVAVASRVPGRNWQPQQVGKGSERREWLIRLAILIPQEADTALPRAVRDVCDVQLLTGLGILLGGFFDVGSSSISVYHWYLIACLAWLSLDFLRAFGQAH